MTTRQNEIIEKAIEIIAEHGIQGLTIKNLSKAINVSEPAIYRHFSNKTEILSTMLSNLGNMTVTFTKDILTMQIPANKKIEKILITYFKIFSEHPYWVTVIFADEIFKNEKQLIKNIKIFLEEKEKIFISLISEGQKNGIIRKDIPKKHLATLLIGSLRILVKKWEMSNFEFNLNTEGKKLVRSLLNLLST